MKKATLVLITLAIFIGLTVTTASAGIYISGNLGAVFLNDADMNGDDELDDVNPEFSFDNGGVATFAVGTSIGSAVRIEAEIGARVNNLDALKFDMDEDEDDVSVSLDADGDVTTISYMANVYYDFKNDCRFTPFIGGGLGFANVEYDMDKFAGDKLKAKDDDNVIAYQLMLGGSFAATEKLSIDLQYRYFATADPDFDDKEFEDTELEYQSHNVMLGLRYSF